MLVIIKKIKFIFLFLFMVVLFSLPVFAAVDTSKPWHPMQQIAISESYKTISIADAMTMTSSLNVGIGTTSPTQKLDVNGNLRLRGAVCSGSNQKLYTTADGTLQCGTDDTNDGVYNLATMKSAVSNDFHNLGGTDNVNDGVYNLATIRSAVSNDFHNLGGTDNVNDGDTSTSNEIQTLSISGNTLYLSSANSVILPSGGISSCSACDSSFINVGESGDSIADNTIDSSEIQDDSLTDADLAANSVGNSEMIDNPSFNIVYPNYISVQPQGGVEGGEIQLKGSGGGKDFQIDNYYGHARIHTLDSGKYFEVIGGAGIKTNGINLNGDYRTSWPISGGAETDTLQTVTNRGATTDKAVTVGGLTVSSGAISLGNNYISTVAYTGAFATSAPNIYVYDGGWKRLLRQGDPTPFDEVDTFQSVTNRGRTSIWPLEFPIFKDINNPGYYVDPASSSRLNYAEFNNMLSYGNLIGRIFYDIDYPSYSYYVDPSSVSNLNSIYTNSIYYYTQGSRSDINLKKDIQSIDNSLAKVLKLEGVSFRWKDETKGKGINLGLIAQDVEKVFPELVLTEEEAGMKGINYNGLVAALIESVKEQQKQIDELKKEVEELKG